MIKKGIPEHYVNKCDDDNVVDIAEARLRSSTPPDGSTKPSRPRKADAAKSAAIKAWQAGMQDRDAKPGDSAKE